MTLIGVYGTLRTDQRAEWLWRKDSHSFSHGLAIAYGWELWDNGSFPYALRSSDPTSTIVLEMLDVSKSTLALLDGYEGYPDHYGRASANVTHELFRTVDNPACLGKALIYTPKDAEWVRESCVQVFSGDWVSG